MLTAVDLTPTPQMVQAVKRAIALADARSTSIEAATRSRAEQIAKGEPLTEAQVKRMLVFFSITRDARTPEWGKDGAETDAFIAHSLYGGDAGQIWAKSKAREMGLSLSETEPIVFKELFCDDDTPPSVDDDGYIWKPVLRTGHWAMGPNGKPLSVIAGHSNDPRRQIGLQDIVDAHNDGAVEHVTIPTSHEDAVEQNTGYVDQGKLKVIKGDDGVTRLWAGHRFTEPDIAEKVRRGTIPNTSVGLEFDYIRKEDGRKFPIVLKHVALTHRPWINRLTPFGVKASEDVDYEIEALVFSEPIEDERAEVANDPAHISDGLFTETELTEEVGAKPVESKSTEGGPPAHVTESHHKEADMSEKKTDEKNPEFNLAEHPDYIAQTEKNARLQAQLDQLLAKDRVNEAEAFVGDLKGYGFTEEKGCTEFLKFARNIVLSDKGETSLLFSEEGSDAAERPLTAIQIVRELFSKLPKATAEGKKLAVQFSEMASDPLRTSESDKPPLDETRDPNQVQMSEEEMDQMHREMFPEQYANQPAAS